MNFKTSAVRAVALAMTLTVTSFGALGSGAVAQSEPGAPFVVPPLPAETEGPAPADDLPRFVAEPVVQALPTPADADSLAELVATLPDESDMSRDMTCLAQAIYFEARGEDLDGQLAVAQVIINRTQTGSFPGDYCGVVTQPAQFSFVRGGRIPSVRSHSAAWHRAKAIARIAHDALWDSEAGDALYFHATRISPSWAHTKLARATIDSHVFYR